MVVPLEGDAGPAWRLGEEVVQDVLATRMPDLMRVAKRNGFTSATLGAPFIAADGFKIPEQKVVINFIKLSNSDLNLRNQNKCIN